jgi:hypothetical protein
MVRRMKAGSVIVYIAIDQGGCFETMSRRGLLQASLLGGVLAGCSTAPGGSSFDAGPPLVRNGPDLLPHTAGVVKGRGAGMPEHAHREPRRRDPIGSLG